MDKGDGEHTESKKLHEQVTAYLEKRLELFKYTISEQISLLVAETLQKLFGIVVLSAGGLFVWLALGFFIGEWIGSLAIGFLVASLPLLIAGFILTNTSSQRLTDKIQADVMKKTLKSFKATGRSSGKDQDQIPEKNHE